MKAAVCFWVLCGCLWTWDGNGLFAVSLINYAKEKKVGIVSADVQKPEAP